MFTGWGTYYLSAKNLFQHLTILFVKNFFLTPHINQPLVQSHYPLFSCNRPCQKVNIERLQKAVTEAFSSPEWANPTPFPLEEEFHHFDIFVALLLLCSKAGLCLSCVKDCRAGCHIPSGKETSVGAESSPTTCWRYFFRCIPGYTWPSGLQTHIASFCPTFHPTPSPRIFLQTCFWCLHPVSKLGLAPA